MLLHTIRTLYFVVQGAFFAPVLPSLFSSCATRIYVGFRTMDIFMHVNNARYLELFEFARWHHGARAGMIEKIRKTGIIPVVGVAHIQYVNQLKCFQFVTVHTRIVGSHKRNFLIEQRLTSLNKKTKEEQLHATLLLKATFIDKRGKAVDIMDVLKLYDMDVAEYRRSFPFEGVDHTHAATSTDAVSPIFEKEFAMYNEADDLWRKALREEDSAKPAWRER